MVTTHRTEYDYLFKIVLIGDASVGKSCILLRFADDQFKENYMTTIGVDFRFKTMVVDKKYVKLQIWDTAGQERYKTITSAYYRSADGIIVVFDLNDRTTFQHVNDWLKEVEKHTQTEDVVKIIVGNKNDMSAEREVSQEEIRRFTKETGIPVLETSAKLGDNIENTFAFLTKELISVKSGKATNEYFGVKLGDKLTAPSSGACCSK